MPYFSYRAFSNQGERFSGYRLAETPKMLARDLLKEDLYLVSCRRSFFKKLFKTPKEKEFQDFLRHMATLLKAGFSLGESLESYEGSSSFESIIFSLLRDIKQGKSFPHAFQNHFSLKDPLISSFMTVAEKKGILSQGFEHIILYLKEKNDLKSKIMNSLGYPVFLFVLVLLLISFLLTEVVPQLDTFLRSGGSELPLQSQLLLSFSNQIGSWIKLFSGAVFFLFPVVFLVSYFSEKGALFIGKKCLKIPLIGSLLHKREQLLFLKNIYLLLEAGVLLPEAMELSCSGNSAYFKNAINQVYQDVIKGHCFSEALALGKCLDSRSLRFIKAGELSGNMSSLLIDLTAMLKDEIDQKMSRLLSLLEPASMVLVGGLLLWIVSAFFVPLYEHLNEVDF
tara:strand:- start:5893 stop:7077 length:1185 start_codon:yes stop_codon:yes gene_type:complete